MTKYEVEEKTVEYLKTVFDPEIPVNVWDLGMIYKIDVKESPHIAPSNSPLGEDGKGLEGFDIDIDMTFTAPNCPAADFILEDIQQKLEGIPDVKTVNVNVVFEPEWNKDMMSEEAKLDLGFM
ncbi:MAG: iron-sulfur cluster assembly protein [Bacteroidales bacterium]|nr:iron-sulfur cluster assembly protein [Bacteroidales bacterium]